jgi:hypothetical protein
MAGNWRGQAGMAIVLLMGALAICTYAASWRFLGRHEPDSGGIVMDEDRFAGLRAVLPAHGTVGYLSDTRDIEENPRAYYLTQYFLTPIVVAPDAAHDIVIANFASRSDMARAADANGLTIENEFSHGVALLRRRR